MPDVEFLKARLETLLARDWDLPAIETRFQKLLKDGIVEQVRSKEETIHQKQEILDRVQRRAEEYCYLTRNCAKGSATALLEEFGLGNMEIIKALSPFPGLGMTGGICGPVSGGLAALALYFSSEDTSEYQDARSFPAAHKYLERFKYTFGSLACPDIQEVLLGKYYDPMAGPQNREAFNEAKARQKCPVAPGLGARLAAEIIIESMAESGE